MDEVGFGTSPPETPGGRDSGHPPVENGRTLSSSREGASPSLSIPFTQRELRRIRDELIQAAGDPRLEELDVPPAWPLALAAHIEAVLNGWLDP